MRRHAGEFDRLDLRVVVVTFETRERAEEYLRETGLRWPLLIDRQRAFYHAYGMGRGSWRAIWGPTTWRAYIRLIARGGWPRRGTDDVHQLGGDVLVDPDGKVALHHVGTGPADRPAVAEILGRVRRAQRG